MKSSRILLITLFLGGVLASWGQDRSFKQGLPDSQIGAAESRGYIKWAEIAPLGDAEDIVALLKAHKYISAENEARRQLQANPAKLVAADLLLQSIVAQKSITKLEQAEDFLDALLKRQPLSRAATPLKLATMKCLLLECSRDLTPPIAKFRKLQTLMEGLEDKLDGDVAASIVYADVARSDAINAIVLARSLMKKCVDRNPNSVPARYFLMLSYNEGVIASSAPLDKAKKPQPALVEEQADALLRLDSKFRPAYYYGGLAKLNLGDNAGAKAWLNKYLALHPTKSGPVYESVQRIVAKLGS